MARPMRERLIHAASLLRNASSLLDEAEHERAAEYRQAARDVEAVAAPGGWTKLRNAPGSEETGESLPFPLTMDQDLKDALKAASEELGYPLTAVARDGFEALLRGEYVPPKAVRDRFRRPDRAPSSTLNLRIERGLRDRVQERLVDLSAKVGYRVTLSSTAIPWLADELGVDRRMDSQTLYLVMPKALRDHIVAEAESRGVTPQSVLEDGIRALQDGWLPPRPVKAAPNSRSQEDIAKLPVRVDERLREALHEMAPQVSERLDYRMYPGSIAIAVLKDRLGQPAE